MDDREAAEFIRRWNDAAVRRNGGIVITPYGEIDTETARQITLAKQAGRPVRIIRIRAPRRVGRRVSDRSRR
ncbi:hypothetical protein AGRA3207_007495 [Actinomadura graeca]|uniref:Uncharacterized protein n=1 Tax=Actinomadura graeca TaxID=2750812 RepID=A0ABX8R4C2_9ACTN|nr:hypothetical protein [Actinomadura graeca]QXJ25926.1 hypothetical protein AGRA3207_007495 [Actinomadura graeca]